MWRARSASDHTDEWPFWYLTDDQPPDRNKTAEAFHALHGEEWPPLLPFVDRETATKWAELLQVTATP